MSEHDDERAEDLRGMRAAKDLLIVEEVIAAVRHDVRNKLAAIRQAAYYLRAKTQPTELWSKEPRMARFFDLIEEQVDAADALFETSPLLERLYTRAPKPVAARAIVDAALHASGARVEARVRDVEDADVHVDLNEVALALAELVTNAAEATPDGEEPPVVSGARTEELYAFSVENAGPPLDAKEFRTLLRSPTSTRDGRRGIGLSIARHVATRWGGSVSLRAGAERTTIDLTVRVSPAAPARR